MHIKQRYQRADPILLSKMDSTSSEQVPHHATLQHAKCLRCQNNCLQYLMLLYAPLFKSGEGDTCCGTLTCSNADIPALEVSKPRRRGPQVVAAEEKAISTCNGSPET